MKAIAFDLDDTLLRNDRTVSDYTVEVLRRAAKAGIHVIPASGRARDSMRWVAEKLGCVSCFIACNGAELWAADGSLMDRQVIDVPTLRECAAFAEEYGVYAQVYKDDYFCYSEEGEWNKAYEKASLLRGVYVGQLTKWIHEPTTKLLLMADPALIAKMLPEAQRRFAGRVQATCSKPYFLEINPAAATKGLALQRAGALLGFDMADAVAFGDSLNDLSMLEAAGTGVAMANAREDVKERVRFVCLSNEEDGVARFVEEKLMSEVPLP